MMLKIEQLTQDQAISLTYDVLNDAITRAARRAELPGGFEFSDNAICAIGAMVGRIERLFRESYEEHPATMDYPPEDIHGLVVMAIWRHGFLSGLEAGMTTHQVGLS